MTPAWMTPAALECKRRAGVETVVAIETYLKRARWRAKWHRYQARQQTERKQQLT